MDVVFELQTLDDQKTQVEAGISAGVEVQVLFTPVKPVECPTQWSAGCEPTENLRLVKIPSGATRIADFAFSRCEALVKVEIPNTVTVKLHPTP